jgi:hypothetical protein
VLIFEFKFPFRLGEGQEHGKLFRCFDRVREVGRQVEQVVGLERMRFAGEGELAFAG